MLFESHRKHDAPWCWMEDSYGHGTGRTLDVIIPYFRELLQIRLPVGSDVLLDFPKAKGVMVDLETKSIRKQPAADSEQGVNVRTAILPSSSVYDLWVLSDTGKRKYLEHSDPVEQ